LSIKKVAIVSPSAVNRIVLRKFLENIAEVKVFKDFNFDENEFDLVIVDGDKKCKKCISLKELGFEGYISEDIKKQLTKLIVGEKKRNKKGKYVLIGSSTGGPGLIEKIAKSLPEDYPNAVCVAQHMPVGFTAKFANRLNSISKLQVVEADNSTPVIPGYFIIAKAGWHLHFRKKEGIVYTKLVPNSMGHFFVPSVDEMFFSALEVMNPKDILAVVLTGIGDDGARGLKALREAGAYTIAESEKTAAVYGMPKAAKEIGGAIEVLDFDEIVKKILEFR
jgi:chemotaxis response regulator CheB